MTLFKDLYDRVIQWSKHPKANYFLGGLSFAESSFFPIPPDTMLIPMSLAKPGQWVYLALLTTVTSVLGGIAGYLLGAYAFDWLLPIINDWGYQARFDTAKGWMEEYGIWIIFAAGFSPVPYKLFTVSAGALSMAFLPFVLASIVGRGARFFLVAGLVAKAGPKMEPVIIKYIEWLGWAVVILLLAVIGYMTLR